MTDTTEPITPFDASGVVRTADGVLRYADLPNSLIDMFRAAVDADPDGEALVELGGDRVSFRQWWDRSSRVAGGLRAMGITDGDRVAIHLINGNDWAYRVLRCADGGGDRRAGQHPVLRVRGRVRRDRFGCQVRVRGRRRPAGRRPARGRDRIVRRARRHLLHQRHHRVPEGCDDDTRELPVELRDVSSGDRHGRGRRTPQPDLGPDVPRDRLQQPAAADPLSRRDDDHHADVRRAGFPPRDRGRTRQCA